MATEIGEFELVRTFPQILLEYLRKDEEMGVAAKVFENGQIRLNINNGRIEAIEVRQFARAGKE